MPGSAALNTGGVAEVTSVSCALAGDCAVSGDYTDHSTHQQVFVVSERNGRWGKAIEVPGSVALNKGGTASVGSMSCTSAGNCMAGGSLHGRFFPRSGLRGQRAEQPLGKGHRGTRPAALNKGGLAGTASVSCASAGPCAASGSYSDASLRTQAFVVDERTGR